MEKMKQQILKKSIQKAKMPKEVEKNVCQSLKN